MIDSSALVALLRGEPGCETLIAAINNAEARLLSAVTKVEASMVMLGRSGPTGLAELDAFIGNARIEIVPFDDAQAEAARDAFARFGKGRHAAGLNFGDCCVYALARVTGEPLLYEGGDFAATDVRPAL